MANVFPAGTVKLTSFKTAAPSSYLKFTLSNTISLLIAGVSIERIAYILDEKEEDDRPGVTKPAINKDIVWYEGNKFTDSQIAIYCK